MGKTIGWLANFNPLEGGSGSETNDRGMIEAGIKRGHSINIVTPKTHYVDFANFDIVIISNCNQFPQNNLVDITKQVPYILFHHDFQFCNFQLYFSGLDKCKNCLNKPVWEHLLKNSKLNIFLSPFHYQMYLKVFDKEIIEPHIEVPSCIKLEDYKPNPDIKIKPKTCICSNSLYGFKGRDQVLEYIKNHLDIKFTITGDNPDKVVLPDNANFVGRVTNNRLKELFQESESLLHLPITGPFDRVPIEYKLCNPDGKLIVNDRVGSISYNILEKDKINMVKLKKLLEEAPIKFWESVEKYA